MSRKPSDSIDPATSPGETLGSDAAEIMPPERITPALLMSLLLHVVLLTAIGWVWTSEPKGTGDQQDRPIGIALVHRLPDRDRFADAQVSSEVPQESPASESSAASAAAAPPADFAPPLDLTGLLKSMQSTPNPISGTGLAGETSLDGDAFAGNGTSGTRGDSDQATTMLFGISGSGSRFVYVFDRSDSMNGFGGKPLRAAKAELIRSLRTLTDRQRFQVIFYNDKPTPLRLSGSPSQMLVADNTYLTAAASSIRMTVAFGGTEHDGALKMALNMGPDVIFFLTDARIPRLSSVQMREIKNRADSIGATIHAIEFGPDPVAPGNSFLRELAAQNNGQYQYVNVRILNAAPPNAAPPNAAPPNAAPPNAAPPNADPPNAAPHDAAPSDAGGDTE